MTNRTTPPSDEIELVPPKASVSYSWDDDAHKRWVKESLAKRLREDGVLVALDQWQLAPGQSLSQFMEGLIRDHEYVLVVCTPAYKLKSDQRTGGAGYEGAIMTAELLASATDLGKFVPILRVGAPHSSIPTSLSGRYYIDLRGAPGTEQYESQYQELLRTLHGYREEPPPVGVRPFPPSPNRGSSAVRTPTDDVTARAAPDASASAQPIDGRSGDVSQRASERVSAQLNATESLAPSIAVAALKRHLAHEGGRIGADELLIGEAQRLRTAALADVEPLQRTAPNADAVRRHLENLESRSATFAALMATGCYLAAPGFDVLWLKALGRSSDLADVLLSQGTRGQSTWDDLRYYPATLGFYAGGIAAIAGDRWDLLRALLTYSVNRYGGLPAVFVLAPSLLMSYELQHSAIPYGNLLTPLNERVLEFLREPLRDCFAKAMEYDAAFDRFEYLIALVAADLSFERGWDTKNFIIPLGRFRRFYSVGDVHVSVSENVSRELHAEAANLGSTWPPLKAGLFDRDEARARRAFEAVAVRLRS